MGYKLMRMSYSSIIRESEDFGAALIDLQNRQLAEAKQSTPLQSGPIPGYIRGLRRLLAERGETIEPGDVFMHNDPYAGATHGPTSRSWFRRSITTSSTGFAVTTAHHLDIGAHTPGSGGIVDAIDCYAEGLRFQAIKVYEGGKRNQQVWNMLRTNIRLPDSGARRHGGTDRGRADRGAALHRPDRAVRTCRQSSPPARTCSTPPSAG